MKHLVIKRFDQLNTIPLTRTNSVNEQVLMKGQHKSLYLKCHFIFLVNWNTKLEKKFDFRFYTEVEA